MSILSFLSPIGDIGKPIEANEQNIIFEEIVKYIKKAYTKKDENEINQIIKKGKIKEFYSKGLVEGLCYPYIKTICIKPYIIKNVLKGEMNKTIIHEAIHLLRGIQYRKLFEKKITGFEEGATEYMTVKAMGTLGNFGSKYLINNKGQKIEYNIPSSCYIECTSIMAQLGIIYGEDKLQEFAFGENNDLLKNIKKDCGNNFYEYLRKELYKFAGTRQYNKHILDLQSQLLERFYIPKFAKIETIDEAATLFKELQEINKVRAHFDEDKSFEEFYKSQYEKCIKRFGKDFEDLDYLKYKKIEFLNLTSKKQIEDNFNDSIKKIICYSNKNLEDSLQTLNNIKRYIARYKDTFYQVCVFKDRYIYFQTASEKEGIGPSISTIITNPKAETHKLSKSPTMPNFNSDFYLKNNNDEKNKKYSLIIDGEEVPLAETDLGVTQKDVESYFSSINSLNKKKTLKERFLGLFSTKKPKLLDAPKSDTNIEKNNEDFIERVKSQGTTYNKEITNLNKGNTIIEQDNTER